MNVADVMQALADRAATIEGLRCFAYPPDKVSPPALIVELPETVEFDATYGRGSDSMTIPVVVLVARKDDRTAVKNLLPYLNGSGERSVKQVLESGTYTAMTMVHVSKAELSVFTFGTVDYLGIEYSVDITGKGA
jgi:hypothetical protein